MIVAMSDNRVIGKNNELPWYLPSDLAYFKQKTTNHSIVMGRKTFESIGKVLSNRENIIISTKEDFKVEGATVIHSIEALLSLLESNKRYFIIGGAQIFSIFLPYVDKMWITQIHHSIDGDSFFPEYKHVFKKVQESSLNEENGLYFSYTLWER
jgi:dihydrofolate reductase